jgi:thiol:disulfide interchange protein
VTPSAGVRSASPTARGIRTSVVRVADHLSSLARLEKELARAELDRKSATLGAGAAVAVAAGVFALFAVGFGLATIAAALAFAVAWWLALLMVFAALVVLVLVLALASRGLFESGTPLRPEQAIEEARLMKRALRGTRAG